eukprot:Gb_29638 [translate_table: standard]
MGTPNGIGIGTQRLPEENIMAILDLIGVKEPNDIKDDTVRAISIIPEKGQVPSRKMYEAVFQILRENKSLELAIASYQLLNDLEKRFPRVTVAQVPGLSSGITQIELVWSPFLVSSENDSAEMEGLTAADGDPIDCSISASLNISKQNVKLNIARGSYIPGLINLLYDDSVNRYMPICSAIHVTSTTG